MVTIGLWKFSARSLASGDRKRFRVRLIRVSWRPTGGLIGPKGWVTRQSVRARTSNQGQLKRGTRLFRFRNSRPPDRETRSSPDNISDVPESKVIALVVVFFLTALVSVVTGSTSLITVPALIAAGIEPHVSVATNMLALVFLSVGGSLSFRGKGIMARRILPAGILLTALGSAIGAFLLLDIPPRMLELVIGTAMIVVPILSFVRRDNGSSQVPVSETRQIAGYGLTFALAVYGGLFSGGYVTMLTAVFVFCFGLSFLQSVATTKVLNAASSLIAVVIFARHGLVDYRLGVVLGLAMFMGSVLGGKLALRMPAVWLRRVFLVAVIAFAVTMFSRVFR